MALGAGWEQVPLALSEQWHKWCHHLSGYSQFPTGLTGPPRAPFSRALMEFIYLASPLLQQHQQNQVFVSGGRRHEKKLFYKRRILKKKKKHQNADHQKAESFSNPTQEHELLRGYFKATFCLI